MGSGYRVDVEALHAHIRNVEAIQGRFEAVKSASSHISRDDEAYGLLCGWIAGVLEGRHVTQDELIAFVEENLALVATALRTVADRYEATEEAHADLLRTAGGEGRI